MKIEALRHVIRASAGVTGYKKFLILGSQAILGHCLDKDYDFSVLPGFPWVAPVRNWPGRGPDHHRRSRWLS